jgi:hypothetical protein
VQVEFGIVLNAEYRMQWYLVQGTKHPAHGEFAFHALLISDA